MPTFPLANAAKLHPWWVSPISSAGRCKSCCHKGEQRRKKPQSNASQFEEKTCETATVTTASPPDTITKYSLFQQPINSEWQLCGQL